MFGNSGYGTNAYGSERQSAISQIIRLGIRVFQDVYGTALSFIMPNSARTFQDPTQPQTMKLP